MMNRYLQFLLLSGIFTINSMNAMDTQMSLYDAASSGNTERVLQLIESGVVNVDEPDTCAATPLYVATANCHEKIVELLCQAGADANEVVYGVTPLYLATIRGHEKIVELLCQAGADANEAVDGETLLYLATIRGHEKIVELLCQAGADANEVVYGKTPLYLATIRGHEKIVEILCQAGADFIKNKDGDTPLHIATVFKEKQIAISLVFFYGKPILSMKNNQNQTALDVARAENNEDVEQLISDKIEDYSKGSLLDQEIEKRRKKFFKKEMKENCQRLNPATYLAGREIGMRPLQIKHQIKMDSFSKS